jgi:hypothetical protein
LKYDSLCFDTGAIFAGVLVSWLVIWVISSMVCYMVIRLHVVNMGHYYVGVLGWFVYLEGVGFLWL